MRKFLFRGKDRHGAWHYGACRELPNGFAIIYNNDGGITEVDPDTVGEYIGIDLGGKMIFEDDILHTGIDWDLHNWQVKYCSDCDYPAFDLVGVNGEIFDAETNGISVIISAPGFDAKIIGNIHDNPELMEAK